ncbi:MAG TPA: beta-galactosidase [Planctomycetota bacterium]|nr:beta-galactosidase [Planctomycetota bacterium]
MLPRILPAIFACLISLYALAAVDPAEMRQELERIEDLRILHRYGWTLNEFFFKFTDADGDYLLAKGRKMGISFANLFWDPACNWADIETEPGKYDFAALDKALSRISRFQMKAAIMFRSLTGRPPKFHIDKFGADCQFSVAVKREKDAPRASS